MNKTKKTSPSLPSIHRSKENLKEGLTRTSNGSLVAAKLELQTISKLEEELQRVIHSVEDSTKVQLVLCTLASLGDLQSIASFVHTTFNLTCCTSTSSSPKNVRDKSAASFLNQGDYNRRTPLILAAEGGHIELVKFLVEHGADVHATDRWGENALSVSLKRNHTSIATYLKEQGAKAREEAPKIIRGDAGLVRTTEAESIRFIFDSIEPDRSNKDVISVKALKRLLRTRGIIVKKHKVVEKQISEMTQGQHCITWKTFLELMVGPSTILQRAINNQLVVSNWEEFVQCLIQIFEEVKPNSGGKPASYIPELGTVDPNLFGFSICTIDGQFFSYGNATTEFPMESCGKPLIYSSAVEDHGYDFVHKYVGKEPSGQEFNAFTLNAEHKPHNAAINAGAIVVSAIYHNEWNVSQRFKYYRNKLSELAGGAKIGFNQAVFLSEKDTAHRNFALAYFMASHGGFPEGVSIPAALDFYFQMCSVDANTEVMATIASTYANYGVCPLTDKKTMSFDTVKRTMQLLFSAGMYNYSGEWACTVGLPAKSGVAGCIFVVVPKILGLSVYSPPLDKYGNSVRGVEFATKVAEKFGWNVFDILYHSTARVATVENHHHD